MLQYLASKAKRDAIPIHPVAKATLKKWLADQPDHLEKWVTSCGYKGAKGTTCLVPGDGGRVERALVGVGDGPWAWAAAATRLPKRTFRIEGDQSAAEAEEAALGWALGAYEFTRYRKRKKTPATLVWPDGVDKKKVSRLVEGIGLARDLINTPAGDMSPADLAAEAKELAKRHGARFSTVVGDRLLEKNYPAVHAVGRACAIAPRLVDLRWGNERHPKVTLVGKGVCFDTGGLDLKSASNMKLMKKDMGGAATVLGLAHAVMDAKLPVRLRVLVPAVENSVGGDAFHPLDVLPTRKGLTVEVGNTDAEGRLILCDALAEADREKPDLIVDFATLTGAARVALGTSLPALFATDDDAAAATLAAGFDVGDPLWRMPLFDEYRSNLDSKVADINNIGNSGYGGAILAALFLREFVSTDTPWMHIDTMAWNTSDRPGRPTGGDAPGLRALYTMLERRFATSSKKKAKKKKAKKKKAKKSAEKSPAKKAAATDSAAPKPAAKTRPAAKKAGKKKRRRAARPRPSPKAARTTKEPAAKGTKPRAAAKRGSTKKSRGSTKKST